jgi:2-methylcitrate dehydratase PrpD
MDRKGVADTLEVAASYAITPSFGTAYQGANVRNTYAGIVNRLGLLATDLYTIGFRGEAGGLSTTFGQILGQQFDPRALVDGLGERYEILRGYFKPYSSCRYTHAAVDAALEILAEGDVDLDEIKAIEVDTYDIAAHLADPLPKTPLAGRFSLPYVTAATLMTGGAGPEIFTPEMLTNPGLLTLSQKVHVRENPDYTALTPAKRPAQVRVYFTDRSAREKTVMGSKGDPDQPMTDSELETKFHMLVDPVIGQGRAEKAWETIGHFEELSKMDELFTFLVPDQS